ncbi:MAG: hypothetical protein WBF04_23890 [Candidatus Sulfotelmatobacter sp.]
MSIKRMILIFSSSLVCACTILAHAQADGVKWTGEKENAALWATIRTDFHDELQPDDPVKVAPVLAYSYKYIYRVALYQHSALVLIGHRETEESKYPGYYSVLNYDVESHARKPIKGVEVISVFKFVDFVRLDSVSPPDIFFTWLTCTECEASEVLSAFHYDAGKREWGLRSWEANKGIWWTSESGPVIWSDVSASDTISFDCVHGFLRRTPETAFGIRCREVAESEAGKRTITDITGLYSFRGPDSRLEIVSGEKKTKLLSELCRASPKNKLCRSTAVRAARE